MHYNVVLHYREEAKSLKAESNGLSVAREYFDEKGLPQSEFSVGDVVRVRLTVPITRPVNHLMLSDRLPAGFEALNTRLKTVGPAGTSTQRHWWGYRELRDERVDFSSEYTWRGKHVREYMMRAIAEGRFAVPPAHSELMYEPEKNAQTALGFLTVKAK